MLSELLYIGFVLALASGGFSVYIDAHIGIDKLTQKIESNWLRILIRVVLKVGTATLLIAGLICTIICLMPSKRGRK